MEKCSYTNENHAGMLRGEGTQADRAKSAELASISDPGWSDACVDALI